MKLVEKHLFIAARPAQVDELLTDAALLATMMGFPCLRLDGDFFANCDHRSGALDRRRR